MVEPGLTVAAVVMAGQVHSNKITLVDQQQNLCYNTAMLYFSYGMNTNVQEMHSRCPGVQSLGHSRLINHAFRFAQHADVVKCNGSYVDGVLWEITTDHLNSLDQLEAYPYYYNRRELRVSIADRTAMAIVYFMQPGHVDHPPNDYYFNSVVQGYTQHGVPVDQLYNSLQLIQINRNSQSML